MRASMLVLRSAVVPRRLSRGRPALRQYLPKSDSLPASGIPSAEKSYAEDAGRGSGFGFEIESSQQGIRLQKLIH